MSHYVVLVLGNSKNDYETILAPYDENVPDDDTHIDRTREEIHKEFMDCQGSIIAENKPKSELTDFEKLTLALKKENTNWVDQWCGQRLDDEGNTLSNYNRNSKWDWYEVGGRWSGLLTLKPSEKGLLGNKSWCNEKSEIPENCFDQAYNRQIDWDAMNAQERVHAGVTWDEIFETSPDKCHYRPEYLEELRKIHLEFYGTKEEYIKRRGFWTPYAVVTKDEWVAPGEMMMFGMSSDETKDRDEYCKKFVDLIKKQKPNTVVTVIDCHI
jgi:hypothetical protein